MELDLPRLSWLSDVATSLVELLFRKLLLLIRFASLLANRGLEKGVEVPLLLLSISRWSAWLLLLLLLLSMLIRLKGSSSSWGTTVCGCATTASSGNDWKLLKSSNWPTTVVPVVVVVVVLVEVVESSWLWLSLLSTPSAADESAKSRGWLLLVSKCARNFAEAASSTAGVFCVLESVWWKRQSKRWKRVLMRLWVRFSAARITFDRLLDGFDRRHAGKGDELIWAGCSSTSHDGKRKNV